MITQTIFKWMKAGALALALGTTTIAAVSTGDGFVVDTREEVKSWESRIIVLKEIIDRNPGRFADSTVKATDDLELQMRELRGELESAIEAGEELSENRRSEIQNQLAELHAEFFRLTQEVEKGR